VAAFDGPLVRYAKDIVLPTEKSHDGFHGQARACRRLTSVNLIVRDGHF
jgi:hypothetical protein